jgi:ribokinase
LPISTELGASAMKALTVGSAMIDTIAIIDSGRIERMTMLNADSSFLLLEEGRKTEAEEVSTHVGGGAVNAAVAMARLGLVVAVLAKTGTDARADAVVQGLAQEGISTAWVKRDARSPTGASVLVASHDRNAAIFTFRGANTLLQVDDLHDDCFAVDVLYIANLSNESADCFPAIVERGKKRGALIAANPGPRQLSARGKAFLENLAAIDILILNQIEADQLVPRLVTQWGEGGPVPAFAPGEQMPALAARGLVAGGFQMSIVSYLRAMARLGPKYVAVTDGARGAFVSSGQEILFCPALDTKIVGTAGAGDAFGATLTAYLALGCRLDDALSAAAINSASVVGHVDTQTGLLRRDALEQRLTAAQTTIRKWSL